MINNKDINKILIVAAHPDDEVLMCGGTARRFANEGGIIQTLILGEGITSRVGWTKKDVDDLHSKAHKANELIGCKRTDILDFPDNKFDTIALLDIVKAISSIKDEFVPDMIITHHRNDLNVDHRRTYEATLTASRPMPGESVKLILSGEVLSSTEWQCPISFTPNIFYDISKTINDKISALNQYASEMREYPHPRSIEGIKNNAQVWGMKNGVKYCEAFELVRCLR